MAIDRSNPFLVAAVLAFLCVACAGTQTAGQNTVKKEIKVSIAGNETAGKVKENKDLPVTGTATPSDVLACYFDCHLFSAQFGRARLITPASDATRGKSEVEWLHNSHATERGKKGWVKTLVTKYHTPQTAELVPGMVVLYGASNSMSRGVVRDVLASKNRVVIEWFHAPGEKVNTREIDIAATLVSDDPPFTDPRKK